MTVLFVAFPGSTFNNLTPSTVSTTATILSIIILFLPSEILGTHSINCIVFLLIKYINIKFNYSNNSVINENQL